MQHTASSSAELDFTTCISSTYDQYVLQLSNILPATNGADIIYQVSTNAGSSYDTGTNYRRERFSFDASSSAVSGNASTDRIILAPAVDTTANWVVDGTFHISNPGSAKYKPLYGQSANLAGTFVINMIGGVYTSTTAVNAFRVEASSGNITSGIARCYGVAK